MQRSLVEYRLYKTALGECVIEGLYFRSRLFPLTSDALGYHRKLFGLPQIITFWEYFATCRNHIGQDHVQFNVVVSFRHAKC
jgi:hypothetical protein